MSSSFNEELLSAYLDGELSPAENADVERALAGSESLREMLAELREATEALRTAPRPTAPSELRSLILAELGERRPATARRPQRPAWLPSKSLTATLAACLLLGVALTQVRLDRDAATVRLAATHPLPVNSSADVSASPELAAASVFSVSSEQIRQKLAALESPPQPGNTIYLRSPAQEQRPNDAAMPVVIEMTVVDVMQSVNQLQVLLKERRPAGQTQLLAEPGGARYTTVTLELEVDGPHLAQALEDLPAYDAAVFLAAEEPGAWNQFPGAGGAARENATGELPLSQPSAIQNFLFPVLSGKDVARSEGPAAPSPRPVVEQGNDRKLVGSDDASQPNGVAAQPDRLRAEWEKLPTIRAVVRFQELPEPITAPQR